MDAVEFLIQKNRYCDVHSCNDCPIYDECDHDFPSNLAQEIVDKIEQWSKENPRKTRQSKFLEMFPNASLIALGTLEICPKSLDKDHECFYCFSCDGTKMIDCLGCKNKFWLDEVDE